MSACMFIGHHDCSSNIMPTLKKAILNLIINEKVQIFYIGTNGNFDYFAYKILCELEKSYNIKFYVVLAYLDKQKSTEYYSAANCVFPDVLENTPLRYAIVKRNIYMIEKSNYMICYINHTFSNTYTFVKKAKSKKLQIINTGELNINKI